MPLQSTNDPDVLTIQEWKGLNQQGRRGSIDDQEEWWNENLFAIGPGNLRSCWGPGPAIYTAPAGTHIVRMFFGFIGYSTPQFSVPPPGRFGWMFLDDGSIDQVDLDQGNVTHIPNVWEPIAPYYFASAKVWRPRFFGSVAGQQGGVLFGSPQGLYAFDGVNLTSPGEPAPDWLTDLAETDPSAPIPPMPEGLPGIYAMEVYNSRLWVAGKDVMSFSAPSNGADFSTTDGGGSFGYFGDKLTLMYNDLAAVAGYLWVFGDSSTDLISNVQLFGAGTDTSPFTTNFNYQNVDPQVGHSFPRPVGRLGRHLIQWNGAGVFMLTGADARPIGEKWTNTFQTLDASQYLPTFATANIFGFRVLLCNGRFTDPWGVTRSLLLIYHPVVGTPFWQVASQGLELTNIGHYEDGSFIRPYGTDGTSLYPLFNKPDPKLRKYLATKAFRGTGKAMISIKDFKRLYLEVHDMSGLGCSFTGSMRTRGGGIPNGVEDVAFQLAEGNQFDTLGQPFEGAGISAEIDLQSYSPDFTIERLHLSSLERTLFGA